MTFTITLPTTALNLSGGSAATSLRPTPPPTSLQWPRNRFSPRLCAAVNGGNSTAESKNSFYDLLGISETVGSDEIKRAYKQMALKYHPDVSPPERMEEFTRRFIEVQEAYETLSDPRLRAMYDRDLASGLHFAFSARRRQFDEDLEEKSSWKNRWQDQLAGLKRRSMSRNSEANLSWGAQMRRRAESSSSE